MARIETLTISSEVASEAANDCYFNGLFVAITWMSPVAACGCHGGLSSRAKVVQHSWLDRPTFLDGLPIFDYQRVNEIIFQMIKLI